MVPIYGPLHEHSPTAICIHREKEGIFISPLPHSIALHLREVKLNTPGMMIPGTELPGNFVEKTKSSMCLDKKDLAKRIRSSYGIQPKITKREISYRYTYNVRSIM